MRRLIDRLPPPIVTAAKSVVYLLAFVPNAAYDLALYVRYSASTFMTLGQARRRGMIMKDAHRLEKGLSLPSPRPGFGRPAARRLISRIRTGVKQHGWDEVSVTAVNVLAAYVKFQRSNGIEFSDIEAQLETLRSQIPPVMANELRGGTRTLTREEFHRQSSSNFSDLLSVRCSLRQFDPSESVSRNVIEDAVRLAQRSPSVCNRQTWRVHVFSDAALKRRVLALQNGNRGFGDTIDHVLAITCDLRYFEGPGERNQPYVDGGLFAMTLALSLQHLGAGTCFLNWSAPASRDWREHRIAAIPHNEVIITLMGVGGVPTVFDVAESPRCTTDSVLVWHLG